MSKIGLIAFIVAMVALLLIGVWFSNEEENEHERICDSHGETMIRMKNRDRNFVLCVTRSGSIAARKR